MFPRAGERHGRGAGGRRASDEGQVTLLVLGYVLVVVAVVLTMVSASAVHLARHRLSAVADGAALDAADALDRRRFYAEREGTGPGGEGAVVLTDRSVRDSVAGYLAAIPWSTAAADVRIGPGTGTPDGLTAQVTLMSRVRLPLLSGLLGDRAEVTVTATSRARASQRPVAGALRRRTVLTRPALVSPGKGVS
jgi:hypothetical protein